MKSAKNVVSLVTPLAEQVAGELGYIVWDIDYVKEGTEWFLRIDIDKDGGVSIDDCVDFTHAINKPLDEADPIEQAYCLEVSSPGIERELVRDEHFEKSLGKKVMLKTIRPVDGEREFKGILEAFDGAAVTVKVNDESGKVFTVKETAWIKLDDFDM